MKINWKVRVKNRAFWIAIIPALALLGKQVLELFGIKINKKWEEKLYKSGMILLLFFILMISVNDVWKLFN